MTDRIAMLHGFAGDPHSWDRVVAEWQGSRELVAIALPGHGVPVRATWDDNLAAVSSTIGDAKLVVGYSLGARVALGLVATGRISRAILIGVNPGIGDRERAVRRASDARWVRMLRDDGIAAFVDAWQAQPLFATQVRVPAEQRSARRARRLAMDPEQLARSLEVMGLAEMPDYRRTNLERVSLIAGADDEKFVAIARTLGAPLELIPDCGHDPTLEQPRALARAIASRLS